MLRQCLSSIARPRARHAAGQRRANAACAASASAANSHGGVDDDEGPAPTARAQDINAIGPSPPQRAFSLQSSSNLGSAQPVKTPDTQIQANEALTLTIANRPAE